MDMDAYIGDGILEFLCIRLHNTIFCMPNFKKFHTIFECIDSPLYPVVMEVLGCRSITEGVTPYQQERSASTDQSTIE